MLLSSPSSPSPPPPPSSFEIDVDRAQSKLKCCCTPPVPIEPLQRKTAELAVHDVRDSSFPDGTLPKSALRGCPLKRARLLLRTLSQHLVAVLRGRRVSLLHDLALEGGWIHTRRMTA